MDGISGLVGGLIGLLVGVAATAAFWFSERTQRRLPEQPEPELDDGLVRALAVLRSAAVVLDDDDRVVRASPPALALGLVRDGRLNERALRSTGLDRADLDGALRGRGLTGLEQVHLAVVEPEGVISIVPLGDTVTVA